jgi:hypothetical protein
LEPVALGLGSSGGDMLFSIMAADSTRSNPNAAVSFAARDAVFADRFSDEQAGQGLPLSATNLTGLGSNRSDARAHLSSDDVAAFDTLLGPDSDEDAREHAPKPAESNAEPNDWRQDFLPAERAFLEC